MRLNLLLLICTLLSATFPSSAVAQTPSVKELLERWSERTRHLHNAIIEWETEAATSPKALFGVRDSAAVKSDFVRTLQCRLVTDGERWLLVENGQRWDNVAQRFIETRVASLQSNDGYTILHDKQDAWEFNTAHICKQTKGDAPTSAPDLSAYFLLVNPFHPRHGQLCERRYEYPEQLSEEFWGDHACAVLSFKHRTDGFFAKVYLAADLDWLPVRFELGKRVEVEFRYGPHTDQSTLPAGWTVRTFSPNFKKVENTKIAFVKKWESLPEIPGAEFTIEFPVGTVVWDFRPSEHINFVTLADGSHRPITEKERLHKISVPVLMKTRPDEAVPRDSRSPYRIAVVMVANLIGIVLLLVFVRRMRNKAN